MDNDIRKLNEMLSDKRELYKKYDYCIDLNTNQVKENYLTASYLDTYYEPKNDIRHNFLNKYLTDMRDYHKFIKGYLNKEYNKLDTLNEDIINFNIYFDANYYNGFNVWLKDLLDNDIKQQYLNNDISLLTMAQVDNIKKIGYDNFINIDILNDTSDNTDILKDFLDIPTLIKIQDKIKEDLNNGNISDNYNPISDVIYLDIKEMLSDKIDNDIKDYNDIYKKAHKLYAEISATIKDIINNFAINQDRLNNYNIIPIQDIQQPPIRKIPLLAPIIFNDTYINGTYKTIYKNSLLKLQIKLNLDVNISDFRENIIFYDNLTNKKIDLVPLDYAIFIACAELNANNKSLSGISGNIPISIDSIVQYIADNDKLYNTKTRQKKLYDFIKDRLLLYKSCIVDAIYTKDGKTKKLYNDPIAILENTQFNDPLNENIDYYLIKGSAILTIIAKLEFIEGKPFLTSYTKAKEYINDGQNNTTEILNIKYFILPKLLQQSNRKAKNSAYYPIISLNDMYKSIALLKGKETLTRQEQKRARDSAIKFMDHLKIKGLLKEYDTKPLENSKLNNKPIKAQKIDNIYTRVSTTHDNNA